jgi:hypothetical protein
VDQLSCNDCDQYPHRFPYIFLIQSVIKKHINHYSASA